MNGLTDDALEEAVREGFEHYGFADCDAALAELVERLATERKVSAWLAARSDRDEFPWSVESVEEVLAAAHEAVQS